MRWGSPYLAAQAAYLQHLGTAPGAEVRERDGVYAVRTRVTSNGENAVLSAASAQVTRAQADELVDWFAEWGVPASWLCAEGAGRAAIAAALAAAGYKPERSGWEMRARIAALDLSAAAGGEEMRVEPVVSAAALETWLDIAGTCDWFETPAGRRAMTGLYAGLGVSGAEPLRHYLAWRGDEPVGMASAFFAGSSVTLASVAVPPALRRQGIGRALALARLREARERGCELAVLAPTVDGAELYEALGFESHLSPPDRWFYAPLRALS
jgi:GNAT superfamily N-acetyltransferase